MKNLSLAHIENIFPDIHVNAFTAELKKGDTSSTTHIHNEIEVMYVIAGKIKWCINETEIIQSDNECMFINSRTPHSTYSEENSKFFVLQFPRDKVISTFTELEKYFYFFMTKEEHDYFHIDSSKIFYMDFISVITKILEEVAGNRPHKNLFIHAYSNLLMAILVRESIIFSQNEALIQSLPTKKIMPIIEYINSNYCSDISLEALSMNLRFHKAYLCRLFKKATGKTITEYIHYLRIEKSLVLLSGTSNNITEIALSVGFSSLSHFNSVFHKHIGCSPSLYRKKYDLKK